MRRQRKDRDYRGLELELKTEEYQELLRGLHRRSKFLRRYDTWIEVVAFMHGGPAGAPGKDEVLRPILAAHRQDGDPRWRAVLLAIFWRSLQSIRKKKWKWDPDRDSLWSNITWVFLETICNLRLERRSGRLAQRIYAETSHRLHDVYCREWRRQQRETPAPMSRLVELAGSCEGVDITGIMLRQAQQRVIGRLRQLRDDSVVTDVDFLLLVGSRVYGQTLKACAGRIGINYETAKKRRQRVEARIGPLLGVGRK